MWALPVEWANAIRVTFLIGIVMLSVVVLTGYAGQLSLGQYALGGFGAFIAGRLVAEHDLPFVVAAALGVSARPSLVSCSLCRRCAPAVSNLQW